MTDGALDELLNQDPMEWVNALPAYQRTSIAQLVESGKSFDDVAVSWLTASAENTFRFAADNSTPDRNTFRDNLVLELEGFLCGDGKYNTEREGLFGEKSVGRTYVISVISVAIAPHLGVAAAFIAPVVALTLAAVGKIGLNAWCTTRRESRATIA
jgi:hypothetical protein